MSADRFTASLPTAEEIALFRMVYAETYPVRPLLNEVDRLRAMNKSITEAMQAAHRYIFGLGWNDDPEWKRAQAICGALTRAIYAMPADNT
jgi:hypothetical protein